MASTLPRSSRPALLLARSGSGAVASSSSSSAAPSSSSAAAAASTSAWLTSASTSASASASASTSASSTGNSRRPLSHSAAPSRPALARAAAASSPQAPPSPSSSSRGPRSSTSATPISVSPVRRSAAAPAFRGPASLEPSERVITPIPDLPTLRAWFAAHLPFLALPDNVLLQLITHESHNQGRNIYSSNEASVSSSSLRAVDLLSAGAHNRRLAFLGRRALSAFLALFLHSVSAGVGVGPVAASSAAAAAAAAAAAGEDGSSSGKRAADELLRSPVALDLILHTGRLGDRPGRALQLEQVMRWTSAHESSTQSYQHERGLFTIRGRTLEALVGAIYHQHGANLASQFFHAHILPHIDSFPPSTPRALWDAIKARAEHDAQRLGALEHWASERRAGLGYAEPARRVEQGE
ncbi:hypothetical protein OC834_007048 [Tilletia horrida]|nr:hypothetical protein OC834_007048 [Tilletia horrida]